MITEKLTPLQIRRMERARRNGRKEKRRIAEVSKHRSSYRWSSDWRHERRVYNAEFKKDRFWDRIEMRESVGTGSADIAKAVEFGLKAEAKRAEAQEFELYFEDSFNSKEFMEKLFEEAE